MQIVPGRFFIKLLLTRKHLNVFFQRAYRWHYAQVRSQWGEMDHDQHADSPRLRAQFNSQLPCSPQSTKGREAGCAFPLWGPPWDRYCSALSSSYRILAHKWLRRYACKAERCALLPRVWNLFLNERAIWGKWGTPNQDFMVFLLMFAFFFFFSAS